MTLTIHRIERDGPVPKELQPVHLSCCEHCYHWERSGYEVVGTCRRHPHPTMRCWEKCMAWTNKHQVKSYWDDFLS